MRREADLLSRFPDTQIYDVSEAYTKFVSFTANSAYPIHRWYRFKEGYSRDLVHLLLGSLPKKPANCLDPFGGSGTTPLACQQIGINCSSIEVNPFLHHVARAKLETGYTLSGFDQALANVKRILFGCERADFDEPAMSRITKRPGLKKWLFSNAVLQAILALRHSISELDSPYQQLMLVILASILTDVGNTVKDGKCVRYKRGWQNHVLKRKSVYHQFLTRAELFRDDIAATAYLRSEVSNAGLCMRASALQALKSFESNSYDAVMTSPPYLNSFDYTDVYMPELWVLGFVQSYAGVQQIRSETLCSHVQVKWNFETARFEEQVRSIIDDVARHRKDLWNDTIPQMIGGYFLHMQEVLSEIRRIIRPGGRLILVVATSSYYNVTVPTDLLLAQMADDIGFDLAEIRIARRLKRSTKQVAGEGKSLPPLRESILTLNAR